MGVPQAQTLTVYGRLRGSDNTGAVPAALYTDNIVATITY
jgi:spore coat protein U-like protein